MFKESEKIRRLKLCVQSTQRSCDCLFNKNRWVKFWQLATHHFTHQFDCFFDVFRQQYQRAASKNAWVRIPPSPECFRIKKAFKWLTLKALYLVQMGGIDTQQRRRESNLTPTLLYFNILEAASSLTHQLTHHFFDCNSLDTNVRKSWHWISLRRESFSCGWVIKSMGNPKVCDVEILWISFLSRRMYDRGHSRKKPWLIPVASSRIGHPLQELGAWTID